MLILMSHIVITHRGAIVSVMHLFSGTTGRTRTTPLARRITRVRCKGRTARVAGLSLCFVASSTSRQAVGDPLVGRWILNVARTHYGGGADARQRETFDCVRRDAAVDCRIESVRSDGKTIVGGFAASYDGVAGQTRGIPDVDQVRLTKISVSIADATFTFHGRAVFAYRVVRSSDGRSLTIISVAPDTRVVLNSVVVYDRR